ncbi:ATP/GTP-binding protein, partial [Streptomyces anatolicus]|uniref:ATP/GTP-binding protein n=1 Tax=Streptomyces anatolicus TaxID=2675858 RepID=UPI001CA5C7AF
AEGWADAESAVTKALLLGVFCLGLVAQFVQPVGDALEGKAFLGGAILSLVGYVLYAEVRRLNDALRPEARSEVMAEDLRQSFARALAEPGRARIDAIGFTGETVVHPVCRILEDLDASRRPPVSLRILVPDFTGPMAVPGMLNGEGKAVDDPDLRAALLAKIHGFARDLAELAPGGLLPDGLPALDAQFRALRITPMLKFCLIDGEELFDGIYGKVVKRPVTSPSQRTVLDLMGYQASLTRWHVMSGRVGREKVAQRQQLFDTLWCLASPLPPAGGRATPASPAGAG